MSEQLITLDNLEVSMLPELKGWKEKQEAIVQENPFVQIIDNKTYEDAKKRRTTLVSARTTIEKQDKLLASKLKEVRNKVSTATEQLIKITLPHEEKQQEEVRRYEAIKEEERKEKERIEQVRKEAIQNKIESIYQSEKSKIDSLTFPEINSLKIDFENNLFKMDITEFSEFEMQFVSKVNLIKQLLEEKENSLIQKENQRVEAEKLAQEKAEFEAQKKLQEEADKKEKEEREAKQKAIDAENKRIADELESKQKLIDEANKKRQEELDAKQKAIDDAQAEIEAEKRAKEEAEKKEIEVEAIPEPQEDEIEKMPTAEVKKVFKSLAAKNLFLSDYINGRACLKNSNDEIVFSFKLREGIETLISLKMALNEFSFIKSQIFE